MILDPIGTTRTTARVCSFPLRAQLGSASEWRARGHETCGPCTPTVVASRDSNGPRWEGSYAPRSPNCDRPFDAEWFFGRTVLGEGLRERLLSRSTPTATTTPRVRRNLRPMAASTLTGPSLQLTAAWAALRDPICAHWHKRGGVAQANFDPSQIRGIELGNTASRCSVLRLLDRRCRPLSMNNRTFRRLRGRMATLRRIALFVGSRTVAPGHASIVAPF